MQWEEAKRHTVELWSGILDSVGTSPQVDLLTEINAVTDLCAVARAEAEEHSDLVKCHYCPAYQQFGGCREVCAELSDLVAKGELEEVRVAIRDFLERLEQVETPPH